MGNLAEHRTSAIKHIHEVSYAAEVEVALHHDAGDWGPTLMPADVQKLERIRLALRRGDVAAAAKEAKVYEMRLLAGE